jgi:cytoskeletal protein RodZ
MRMESDEFDFLAPAYVRSFLKTYARFLHLEPGPLVEEFDRQFGAQKFETAQIAALERRSKSAPKQRRFNSWMTAAAVSLMVLVGLAVIGLATGTEEDPNTPSVAQADNTNEAEENEPEEVEPTPTPSPEETFIAITDGIELEVIAAKADSWLEVYADGAARPLYYKVLTSGDNELFRATDKMYIRLGYPAGVELIVNGKNIGSPGGQDPIDIVLPDDVESFF